MAVGIWISLTVRVRRHKNVCGVSHDTRKFLHWWVPRHVERKCVWNIWAFKLRVAANVMASPLRTPLKTEVVYRLRDSSLYTVVTQACFGDLLQCRRQAEVAKALRGESCKYRKIAGKRKGWRTGGGSQIKGIGSKPGISRQAWYQPPSLVTAT